MDAAFVAAAPAALSSTVPGAAHAFACRQAPQRAPTARAHATTTPSASRQFRSTVIGSIGSAFVASKAPQSAFRDSDFFANGLRQEREAASAADPDTPAGSPSSYPDIRAEDYYEVLGVPRNADKKDIKSAYRRLARQYHPDVNKSPDAEEMFKKIARAYEVLSDDQVRARYDQFGEAGVRGGAGPDMGDFGDFGGMPFGDIFDTFFGGGFSTGGGRGRRSAGPTQGGDLRVDLDIDFKTAVFGGEQQIRITHLETCGKCSGTGAKPGTRPKTCGTCGGAGQVARSTRTPFGSFSQVTVCPTCGGEGEVVEASCEACAGAGRVKATKKLSVGIPAGVDTGSRLRVRREGDAGPRGGPPGDMYVYLNVKTDPNFRREGINVFSNIKVSYLDAILGTKIPVMTLDGEDSVEVPSGTQPNTVIKLRGKGVPRLGNPVSRGDHFVTVVVEIPTTLSREERELVEQLREKNVAAAK
eukprot:tig00021350_g20632.t1